MVFIGGLLNQTGTIGKVLEAGTINLTGTMAATLLLIFMVFIAVTIMFKVPLEVTAIILLPFLLAAGAYYSSVVVVLVSLILFISMIIAKNWLFK